MRINSIPPKELYTKYIHAQKKVSASEPVSQTDKAEITTEAKSFSAAFKAAKDSMNVRSPQEQKRIDNVSEQVRNNTYSVSGRDVAKKILGK